MHVCLLSTEIFLWGKYGGFGRATRMIGRELAKRGVKVSAVIPLPLKTKHPVTQEVDGFTVYGYPPKKIKKALDILKQCNADIYHSEEPSFGTYLAKRSNPGKIHIITFRDPKLLKDWYIEFAYPTRNKLRTLVTCLYYENFRVRRAVQHADLRTCASRHNIPRVKRKYKLDLDPLFLPSPVCIPRQIKKSDVPTVCFIGRMDRRKRPEKFFKLAPQFPDVRFIAAGPALNRRFVSRLKKLYSNVPNLIINGFIDQFATDRLSKILGASWILVNTSVREGLPTSFIEACAHKCAILSELDPDGFASEFGYVVKNGDFVHGLKMLLDKDRWKKQGQKGFEYVKQVFENNKVINFHMAMYKDVLNNQ